MAPVIAFEKGVVARRTVNRSLTHSDAWEKAKNGDRAAGFRVVDQVWTDRLSREIFNQIDPNNTVFMTVPSTTRRNMIPEALAEKLARNQDRRTCREIGLPMRPTPYR